MICDTLPCTALLVQVSKESDCIWGSYVEKTTQKQPAMVVFAATKLFMKIHNLATTNAMLMKLTTIMYLHKIFNLAEDWGLNDKA